MAGFGPMYVMSIASAKSCSTAPVPEFVVVTVMFALGRSWRRGPPSAVAISPGAWVTFANTLMRRLTGSVSGPGRPPDPLDPADCADGATWLEPAEAAPGAPEDAPWPQAARVNATTARLAPRMVFNPSTRLCLRQFQ